MAVLFRTCCCNLRTGILLIGIFGLLSSAVGIYAGYYKYNTYKVLSGAKDSSTGYLMDVLITLSCVGIGIQAIKLLVNLPLLASYVLRNRFLAFPWMLWSYIEIVYTFGVTIFNIAISNGPVYFYVATIPIWILSIYFTIVVFLYIVALQEDPSGATAGFPSNTMIHVSGPGYAAI
ncbi:uncharacterized protein LOC144639346 [Oculina patagonica]